METSKSPYDSCKECGRQGDEPGVVLIHECAPEDPCPGYAKEECFNFTCEQCREGES